MKTKTKRIGIYLSQEANEWITRCAGKQQQELGRVVSKESVLEQIIKEHRDNYKKEV